MTTDRPSTPPQSATGSRTGSAPESAGQGLGMTRFRPQKTNLFIAGFMALLAIVAIGFTPWLAPLLLVPVVFVVWLLRVRTTVSDRGITAVYLLRGRRSLPWERFRGVLFDRGGKAYAVGHSAGSDAGADDVKFPLPAISFNSLPALSEASGGRIPDPITPAHAADDAKVKVFDRDGNLVKKEPEGGVVGTVDESATAAARVERGDSAPGDVAPGVRGILGERGERGDRGDRGDRGYRD